MDKELKYFERVLVYALSSLNAACEEGRIPRDDAYVFSLTSIVDDVNPNSTNPTQGQNIVVIEVCPRPEKRSLSCFGSASRSWRRPCIPSSPSENDFMMMDEDLGGDLRMKAMEACMNVIAAIADQHEEDKNQTWN